MKNVLLTIIVCCMAPGTVAFAQTAPARMPAPAQMPPPQAPADTVQHSGGSLLRATLASAADPNQAKVDNVSFFAVPEPQPRTVKKHDLVTVIVNELSEYKSQGTSDLKKQADFDAELQQWFKLNLSNFQISGNAQGGGTNPALKLTGTRDFKGEATVDRADSMTLRVTGEVIDVRPNGTMVVQARQVIKHDEETQEFVLSGVCRVEDITPDNTVLSTQMYDKQLIKNHKGAVRDTTNRGWLGKIMDVINPF